MPQDFSPDQLAERVRDQYRDVHGTDSQIHTSAVWDAAFVNVALEHVRVAKASLQVLARTGYLPITQALATPKTDALPSVEAAEEVLERVLKALRRL